MIDRSLYIGMSGASQALSALQLISNNLANAETTGFKADLAKYQSEAVAGPGLETRVYSSLKPGGVDFSSGSVRQTDRSLDIAVNGKGWIAVQSSSGQEAYTRAGNLQINAQGLLLTGSGQYVLGNQGPVSIPPASKIQIGQDGTISILPQGQTSNTLVIVDRIKLTRPDQAQLRKGEDGLFYFGTQGQAPADTKVKLISGALEGSNVNLMSQIVDLIIGLWT